MVTICAVCYSPAASSSLNGALTVSILLLLGITFSILGGLCAFAFYIRRQARKAETA